LHCLALAGCLAAAKLAGAADNTTVANHLAALAATLGTHERAAIAQIPEPERQLLALRSYLRTGANLRERWSWSEEQINAFARTRRYEELLRDIAAVKREFERRNPGYTLYINTDVRSLDTQLERWNSNPRVGATARRLHGAARQALVDSPVRPDGQSLTTFKNFLQASRPEPVAPLAAPGLSKHGQLSAIDFQIMRDGRVVAATSVATVAREWEASGWSRRLKQAVTAAGGRFEGPLQSPNEPWHYDYVGAQQVLTHSVDPRGR